MSGLNYWGQLLLLPVYWLSFLVPRDKRIWLFGSTFGRRFADNPRYLYLYISQNKKKLGVRPIWISHKKEIIELLRRNGYEAYYYHSFKGIWYALRGKVYLYDNYSKDINFWQSGGAVKVNLWHGIPLKKIQADNVFDKFRHPKNLWERWKCFPRRLSDEKPHHYVLTTSAFLKPIFKSAFQTNYVFTSGYPRNDQLISKRIKNLLTDTEKSAKKQILRFLKSNAGETCTSKDLSDRNLAEKSISKKMVYYMPTFRESEGMFFDVVDLQKFQKFLKENNLLFCTKLHPKSKLKKEFDAISGDNIIVIDADVDPYVFLKMADVLVTDYSSIYFDFLLTGRPIVFFNYDLKEYLRDSREMYFDYETYTPGEKAKDQRALEKALIHACFQYKEVGEVYGSQRERLIKQMFRYRNGSASERLTKDIWEVVRRRKGNCYVRKGQK